MALKQLVTVIALSAATVPTFAQELITNGSFEQPAFAADPSFWNTANPDGPYFYGSTHAIPGWSSSGSSGVWLPSGSMFTSIPDGKQAGWTSDGVYAGSLTQDTGHILAANESLVFSISVGDRANLHSQYNDTTDGIADLYAGTTKISEIEITNIGSTGNWTTVTESLSSAFLATYVGKDLSVVLSTPGSGPNGGYQASWDAISLQAVPEPFSMTLLGLGAAALLRKRK
jgi:hypothetical protein